MSGNFGQASLRHGATRSRGGGVTARFKTLVFVLNFIAIFFESQRAGLILCPFPHPFSPSCESAIIFENYLKLRLRQAEPENFS